MASPNQASKMTMSGIGEMLRDAREKKSLTVDQAQRQTHIHSTVIRALEEGRCDDVLNPTYVKSFLKKYADYLGLDSRRVLDEYRAIHPDAGKQEARPLKTVLPAAQESEPDLSRLMPAVRTAAIAVAGVIIILVAGGRIMTHFKKPAFVKTAGAAKQAADAARSRAGAKKKTSAKKTSAKTLIPKNVPLKLLLKVNQEVLVKLKVDGNLIFGKVLTKGTAEEFTADKAINIFVARGEFIELVLNGKSLGSPGKGVLDNVEITRSGLRVK